MQFPSSPEQTLPPSFFFGVPSCFLSRHGPRTVFSRSFQRSTGRRTWFVVKQKTTSGFLAVCCPSETRDPGKSRRNCSAAAAGPVLPLTNAATGVRLPGAPQPALPAGGFLAAPQRYLPPGPRARPPAPPSWSQSEPRINQPPSPELRRSQARSGDLSTNPREHAALRSSSSGCRPSLEKTLNIFTRASLTYVDVLFLLPLGKPEYIYLIYFSFLKKFHLKCSSFVTRKNPQLKEDLGSFSLPRRSQ